MTLFETLRGALLDTLPSNRLDPATGAELENLAFFEAYFSNFIEGTKFAVEEARRIAMDAWIPPKRPADAHDVLGTFRVVSSLAEMTRRPGTPAELHQLLRARHAEVMSARPDQGPGRYKTEPNQAGNTVFVAPELVAGTLERCFELYASLTAPLHRATFMMCLVSEVHPFSDGNGRVARIMMNAELVAAGHRRIIIPTVYRQNYLVALKALSQSAQTEPIIRVLDFAQRYTQLIDFRDFARAKAALEATNAFVDPIHEQEAGIRLRLPGDASYDGPG